MKSGCISSSWIKNKYLNPLDNNLDMCYRLSVMAKYDSVRKLKRNGALFDYKSKNPNDSWKEVGEAFGVSAQRAFELYQNEKRRRESLEQIQVAD